MPPKDWPAAHSMDTAWYAVDADGNIGRFETGEAGAMPHEAANEAEGAFNVRGLHLAAQAAVGAVRLGANFADAKELQLADHLDEGDTFNWDELPLRGEDEA